MAKRAYSKPILTLSGRVLGMILGILRVVIVSALSATLSWAQEDTIRVNTSLVSVPITVVDRQGRYFAGLVKENFHIFEDANEQQIDFFQASDAPVSIVMVLDCSGSMIPEIRVLERAATVFINQLRPTDQVSLITFGGHVNEVLRGTAGMLRRQPIKLTPNDDRSANSRIFDGVETAQNNLRGIPGRKAILLLTDGVADGDRSSPSKNLKNALEDDALIYTIRFGKYRSFDPVAVAIERQERMRTGRSLQGLAVSDKQFEKQDAAMNAAIANYMNGLASVTGGRAFRIEEIEDLEKTFGEISAELSQQYTLGYYSNKPGEDGERRKITVKVDVPDVAVRSRSEVVYNKSKN